MQRTKFNEHVQVVFDRSVRVLVKKNDEYANADEVFHNFNNAVGISLHNSNVAVAWEFVVKHLQSVKDLVTEIEEDNELNALTIPQAYLDEKFGDVINYFILIEGMIKEKIAERESLNGLKNDMIAL